MDVRQHCVYLLSSENPVAVDTYYIGYTTDPLRREQEHNGEDPQHLKGASYTRVHGRPWRLLCVLTGFTEARMALKFEWAWQHPRETRWLRRYFIPSGHRSVGGGGSAKHYRMVAKQKQQQDRQRLQQLLQAHVSSTSFPPPPPQEEEEEEERELFSVNGNSGTTTSPPLISSSFPTSIATRLLSSQSQTPPRERKQKPKKKTNTRTPSPPPPPLLIPGMWEEKTHPALSLTASPRVLSTPLRGSQWRGDGRGTQAPTSARPQGPEDEEGTTPAAAAAEEEEEEDQRDDSRFFTGLPFHHYAYALGILICLTRTPLFGTLNLCLHLIHPEAVYRGLEMIYYVCRTPRVRNVIARGVERGGGVTTTQVPPLPLPPPQDRTPRRPEEEVMPHSAERAGEGISCFASAPPPFCSITSSWSISSPLVKAGPSPLSKVEEEEEGRSGGGIGLYIASEGSFSPSVWGTPLENTTTTRTHEAYSPEDRAMLTSRTSGPPLFPPLDEIKSSSSSISGPRFSSPPLCTSWHGKRGNHEGSTIGQYVERWSQRTNPSVTESPNQNIHHKIKREKIEEVMRTPSQGGAGASSLNGQTSREAMLAYMYKQLRCTVHVSSPTAFAAYYQSFRSAHVLLEGAVRLCEFLKRGEEGMEEQEEEGTASQEWNTPEGGAEEGDGAGDGKRRRRRRRKPTSRAGGAPLSKKQDKLVHSLSLCCPWSIPTLSTMVHHAWHRYTSSLLMTSVSSPRLANSSSSPCSPHEVDDPLHRITLPSFSSSFFFLSRLQRLREYTPRDWVLEYFHEQYEYHYRKTFTCTFCGLPLLPLSSSSDSSFSTTNTPGNAMSSSPSNTRTKSHTADSSFMLRCPQSPLCPLRAHVMCMGMWVLQQYEERLWKAAAAVNPLSHRIPRNELEKEEEYFEAVTPIHHSKHHTDRAHVITTAAEEEEEASPLPRQHIPHDGEEAAEVWIGEEEMDETKDEDEEEAGEEIEDDETFFSTFFSTSSLVFPKPKNPISKLIPTTATSRRRNVPPTVSSSSFPEEEDVMEGLGSSSSVRRRKTSATPHRTSPPPPTSFSSSSSFAGAPHPIPMTTPTSILLYVLPLHPRHIPSSQLPPCPLCGVPLHWPTMVQEFKRRQGVEAKIIPRNEKVLQQAAAAGLFWNTAKDRHCFSHASPLSLTPATPDGDQHPGDRKDAGDPPQKKKRKRNEAEEETQEPPEDAGEDDDDEAIKELEAWKWGTPKRKTATDISIEHHSRTHHHKKTKKKLEWDGIAVEEEKRTATLSPPATTLGVQNGASSSSSSFSLSSFPQITDTLASPCEDPFSPLPWSTPKRGVGEEEEEVETETTPLHWNTASPGTSSFFLDSNEAIAGSTRTEERRTSGAALPLPLPCSTGTSCFAALSSHTCSSLSDVPGPHELHTSPPPPPSSSSLEPSATQPYRPLSLSHSESILLSHSVAPRSTSSTSLFDFDRWLEMDEKEEKLHDVGAFLRVHLSHHARGEGGGRRGMEERDANDKTV